MCEDSLRTLTLDELTLGATGTVQKCARVGRSKICIFSIIMAGHARNKYAHKLLCPASHWANSIKIRPPIPPICQKKVPGFKSYQDYTWPFIHFLLWMAILDPFLLTLNWLKGKFDEMKI